MGVSGTVGAATLTVEQMPSHSHTVPWKLHIIEPRGSDNAATTNVPQDAEVASHLTGSSQSHSHGLSGSVGSANSLPPYYALAYIIRVA